MKKLDYCDIWNIAFTDGKGWFNENYLTTFIKRNNEYKECSLVISDEELKIGLPIHIDNMKFYITSYDYDYPFHKVIKKNRTDSWSYILKQVEKESDKK